jgi:hypothetical protein
LYHGESKEIGIVRMSHYFVALYDCVALKLIFIDIDDTEAPTPFDTTILEICLEPKASAK